MAYNEFLADRIRQHLQEKKTVFEEKKMMGGLCFMVDG
ncbi:MAG: RNA methyltransferase, partial [Bacteroidetes bacterium]